MLWIASVLIGLSPLDVATVIGEHDCPLLFALLTPEFQRQVPAKEWPSFCNGNCRIDWRKFKNAMTSPVWRYWQCATVRQSPNGTEACANLATEPSLAQR